MAPSAPEPQLEAFTVRRTEPANLHYYRDANGVFHFVDKSKAEVPREQARNTVELEDEVTY